MAIPLWEGLTSILQGSENTALNVGRARLGRRTYHSYQLFCGMRMTAPHASRVLSLLL